MTNRDPNDYFPQDDLDAPAASPARSGKDGYVRPEVQFAEGCPKCRGTGKFTSWSGRVLGDCFSCKGAGKHTFKTSPEARAKSQARASAKRVEKGQQIEADAKAFVAAHPAEIEWLMKAGQRNIERGGTFTFPQDVLNKLWQYGSLTDGQLAAVQKLMARDVERAAQQAAERTQRDAAAPAADVSKLEAAFTTARERAERTGQMGVFVKPLKLTADGVSVAISPGKPGSKWDGFLFVRDAKDDERKLGMFKGGRFIADRNSTPAEQAAILTCATDPHAAVVAYAKAWSRCGVCGHTLLNDVSIEAGMGPVCRAKFGWA